MKPLTRELCNEVFLEFPSNCQNDRLDKMNTHG